MHYPAPISICTSSSSDYDLRVGTPSRLTASTPNLRSICTEDGPWNDGDPNGDQDPENDQQGVRRIVKKAKPRKEEYLDRSSSFVATNSELPIIDISTFNYNSYRHKLIEDNLKKRYKERQPPGDVIFNSIHLNTQDSTLGIKLNEEYDHSFFDFVEEYYDASMAMSKKEMEFLHPLDHFLVRGVRQTETSEKGTETNDCSTSKNETDRPENQIETKSNDRRSLFDKNGNITKGRVKNISGISETKTGNESARSIDLRKDTSKIGRTLPGSGTIDTNAIRTNNEVAKGSNVDRTGTRRSTRRKSSSETFNSRKRGTSIPKVDKESINVGTTSSSELESVYSESGKQVVNVTSNHSRDSSVATSNRGRTDSSKPLPWIVSNPTAVSFNRKYGNKSPDTRYKRRKRKVRSSERPSSGVESYSRTTSPRPKSASAGGSSKRTSNRDSSEVEEVVKLIEERKTMKETESMKSKELENSSRTTFEKLVSSSILHSSKISPRPVSKLIIPSQETNVSKRSMDENVSKRSMDENVSKRSTDENVSDRSYRKFKGKRDRAAESRSMRQTQEENQLEGINPRINDSDRSKVVLNSERSNSMNRSWKASTSFGDDRTRAKLTAEGFVGTINKLDSPKESTVRRKGKKEKSRNDILAGKETRKVAGLSNFDKTRELSRGDKSNRCWKDKTDGSKIVLESTDTLVLGRNDSREEKENFSNCILGIDENDRIYVKNKSRTHQVAKVMKEKELVLPREDSKVGLAMQNGLKNYIKTLKQVLKNDGNVDLVDLASLSLKDAISPELESILSASELKELQDLLNIAEIKSNLATKDVVAV